MSKQLCRRVYSLSLYIFNNTDKRHSINDVQQVSVSNLNVVWEKIQSNTTSNDSENETEDASFFFTVSARWLSLPIPMEDHIRDKQVSGSSLSIKMTFSPIVSPPNSSKQLWKFL